MPLPRCWLDLGPAAAGTQVRTLQGHWSPCARPLSTHPTPRHQPTSAGDPAGQRHQSPLYQVPADKVPASSQVIPIGVTQDEDAS